MKDVQNNKMFFFLKIKRVDYGIQVMTVVRSDVQLHILVSSFSACHFLLVISKDL